MKNLDQIKQNRLEKKRLEQQLKAQEELKAEIKALQQSIANQEPIDLTVIEEQIKHITDSLDLKSQFTSLEKSLNDISQTLSNKTNKVDFSELTKSIAKIKESKPIVNVTTKSDVSLEYKASDAIVGDAMSYYGFLHPTGKWYILRQSGNTDANFRYTTGVDKYREAWGQRESLEYGLYNEVSL